MEMMLDNDQAGNISPSQTISERFHFPFVNSKLSSSTAAQTAFIPKKKEKRRKHQPELFPLLCLFLDVCHLYQLPTQIIRTMLFKLFDSRQQRKIYFISWPSMFPICFSM